MNERVRDYLVRTSTSDRAERPRIEPRSDHKPRYQDISPHSL